MENLLVRFLGWPATILHGDTTVFDRWKWLSENLESGTKRTLDAGCGTGAFTLYAAKIGNEALGISFNKRNMEVAQERAKLMGLTNVKFIEGDLRELDKILATIGTFDQVLCFETVEHLLNDQKLLNDIARCMKPGARLLLTTPYKGHRPVIGESTDPNYLSQVEDGGHVRYGYSEEELKKLVSSAGLKLQKFDFVSGFLSQKLYNLGCRLDSVIPHKLVWALTFPLRSLVVLDPVITSLLKYPGLSIALVATKPIST
jgi:2-polyprenyl-3-methyl-5-hydroxy-6-metoxy-1,4-benzoquinol methylase